jgi:hypothetical protein
VTPGRGYVSSNGDYDALSATQHIEVPFSALSFGIG